MRTFESPIKFSGVGIHSGAAVNVTIKPSKKPGIFFKRADISESAPIPATYDNVGRATLQNTTVGDANGAHVSTIEHLMAAMLMVGADSAVIEIDGPETPILDGSALELYRLLSSVKTTGGGLKKIVVKKEVIVRRSEIIGKMPVFARVMLWIHNQRLGRREDGFVRLSPDSRGLDIRATLDYPDKVIGRQSFEYLFDGSKQSVETFLADIAAARTFGRLSEWEYLKKRGMGRGANESNVIALNDKGDAVLNNLIWPDEFVRHKIIDALGDMFTSGGMIVGRLETVKGSHSLNNLVLKKLFSDPSNYDIIE
jgi:UDP-3-O-[3-hydroxymyristoyl] N-acetylglucosamine deacetylase